MGLLILFTLSCFFQNAMGATINNSTFPDIPISELNTWQITYDCGQYYINDDIEALVLNLTDLTMEQFLFSGSRGIYNAILRESDNTSANTIHPY